MSHVAPLLRAAMATEGHAPWPWLRSTQAAATGCWRVDVETDIADWAPETASIHETPETRQIGLKWTLDVYPPEYRDLITERFQAWIDAGIPVDEGLQIVTARGNRVRVRAVGAAERDAGGRTVAVLGAFQDLSLVVRLEKERSNLRDRLYRTLERMSDGFVTIDPSWRSSYVNRKAEDLLKRGRDELLGADVSTEFPEAIGTRFEDVTRERETDALLRRSQNLEAIGQLTGGVAHDFNNLLPVILGNAELLAEELGDQPQLRKLAGQVIGAAQRGADLTSRLLAFARQPALDPVVTDLNQAMRSILPLLRRSLGEDVDPRAVLAEDLRLVEIDPGQFETARLNLALNARDAMPVGGRLTIETGNVRIDAETAGIVGIEAGGFVVVAVSDTGAGMAPEIVDQVLELVFTTKGQGSGLGLPMVYGFTQQSGGHLKISSEIGEGTTIKLYVFPTGRSHVS